MNGKDIVNSFQKQVEQRMTLEKYWKDAFRYTLPLRGQTFYSNTGDAFANATNAQSDQANLFDSTATDAVRLLASSIISGLTPSNNQWFTMEVQGVKTEEVPYEGQVWLQEAGKRLFKMIHTSNYNAQAFEFFQDESVGGMVGLFIDKEPGGAFNFELWSLGTLYVADSQGKGFIDTVYRVMHITASEAVSRFGIDKLPDSIKTAYETKPAGTQTFEFVHCIRPRIAKNGKPANGKLSNQLPIQSVYVCRKTNKIVKDSGFHEMPVVIPRWSVIPGTAYAVGPINDCLPDIKTLNKVREMMLTNAEMAISGTYVAKHDGILNPNTIRIGPRRVLFAADAKNIQPLATGGNFQIAFEVIADLQRQIKSIMMADQLSPIQKDYASATEVTVRAQIIRQILGPVYSRLQSEYLQPLLERCFGLALRDGSLGQPPQSIAGAVLVPEYQSPMSRAMKMEDVSAMDQYEGNLANASQVRPDVMDLYDYDMAYRKRADLLGVPVELIKSKEKVTMERQAQAQAQQEQMQAEQEAAMVQPQ